MAVTQFDTTNAAVTITGDPATFAGVYWSFFSGCELAVNFTGTDFELYIDQGLYTWYLDSDGLSGGTDFTNGSPGYVMLATGVSDAPHTIIIKCYSAGHVAKPTGIQVTGAAPAIAKATGYGPFVQSWQVNYPSYVSTEGGYSAAGITIYNNAALRYQVTSGANDQVRAQILEGGGAAYAIVDGVAQTPVILPDTARTYYGWITLATGLAAGLHTIEIVTCRCPPAGGFGAYTRGIMTVTGALNAAYVPGTKPYVGAFGDSVLCGQEFFVPNTNVLSVIALMQTQNLTYSFNNDSIPGTSVVGGFQNDDRCQEALKDSPRVLFILGGDNDLGTSSAAVFGAAYQTMLQKLLDGVAPYAGLRTTTGNMKIRCLYLLEGAGGISADYNTAIDAAIAALTLPANAPNIQSVNTRLTGWPTHAAGDFYDGFHPNAQGYAKMYTMMWSEVVEPNPGPTSRYGYVVTFRESFA